MASRNFSLCNYSWLPPAYLKLQMNGAAVASGMGTCILVGQIGVYTGWINDIAAGTKSAITAFDWIGLILISFILPGIPCLGIGLLPYANLADQGDLKLGFINFGTQFASVN